MIANDFRERLLKSINDENYTRVALSKKPDSGLYIAVIGGLDA
jgi:hypothetical protein